MTSKAITVGALAAALFVSIGIAGSGAAFADETQWEKNHPRRDQVNDRLENQNRRIHKEVAEGEITKRQAAKLHAQDHAIRTEERAMASAHGGHITKAEQAQLNRQENRVSREIGN